MRVESGSLFAVLLLVVLQMASPVCASLAEIDSDDQAKIVGPIKRLFEKLRTVGGQEALDSIQEQFKPEASSAQLLALRIDELVKKFGAVEGYDLVGFRTISGSQRYCHVAFLTYHNLSPVLWEAVAYKRQDGWAILELRFSSEGLADKAGLYDQ
jgi:hypothetical protein